MQIFLLFCVKKKENAMPWEEVRGYIYRKPAPSSEEDTHTHTHIHTYTHAKQQAERASERANKRV